MSQTFSTISITLCLVLFIYSCSSADVEESFVNNQIEETRIEPLKELVIEETDNRLFGRLSVLDVDHEGQIYVVDNQLRQVLIFDPKGHHIQTVGREGSGPGEFQFIGDLMVESSDAFYVYDNRQLRITEFVRRPDVGWEFQHHLSLQDIRPEFPNSVYKATGGFIVAFMRTASDESVQRIEIILSHIDHNGELINDKIVTYTDHEIIVEQTGGEWQALHPIPFNWYTTMQIIDSKIIYIGKSDSLRVKGYDLDGQKVKRVSNQIRYRPVTSSDVDHANITSNNPAFNYIPDDHPAFLEFHPDDEGRFWFNLGEFEEDRHTWVVLDGEGSVDLSLELPGDYRVHKIRFGNIYGIHQEEDGQENIVVYTISRNQQEYNQ